MTKIQKNKITNKHIISTLLVAFVFVAGGIFSIWPKTDAWATDYATQSANLNREIDALKAEEENARSKATELKKKAATLSDELAGIDRDKQAITLQIKISQAEYDKLQLEIKNTEKQIDDNRRALGAILTEMSLEDEVSPIERLAGSENISVALDKFEYKNAVKSSLTDKVGEIREMKEDLEKKRDEVKVVLTNQQKSEDALKGKIAEQNRLIAETKGEESEYLKYAKERESAWRKKSEELQNLFPPVTGGGNVTLPGTSGGYPWNAGNCPMIGYYSTMGSNGIGGDGLGYGCRQCVSYTAWRLLKEKGIVAANWGNANMWPNSARAAGFSTGSAPRAGSMGVISAGEYGHIVWVEAVEGNSVIVSQYNYWNAGGPGWGHYSRMKVPASTYDTYIYF